MLMADSPYFLTGTMSLVSMSSAILYPIIFARSIEIFPDIKGTASSAIMGMRYFVCSGLVGVATYVYNGKPFTLAIVIAVTSVIIGFLIMSLLNSNQFMDTTEVL
jgi:MFS transporter, DHA1 family, multidrug resistance protein